MNKYTYLLLSFLFLLTACQKENISNTGSRQNTSSPLLQKVVVTNYGGSVYTHSYKYDGQDRLTMVSVGTNFYNWKASTSIEYDNQNHMTKASYFRTDSNNVPISYNNSYVFEYINNRLVKSIYVALSPTTAGGENHSYSYDSIGRLIADTSLPTVPNSYKRYTAFIYDGNNNVVKRNEYYQNTLRTGYTHLYEYTSTYDNHPNPYINIGLSYFPIFTDRYCMSANNLTGEYQVGNTPQIYIHTYNSIGQVTKSVYYPQSNPQLTSTFEYFYQ